MRFTSTGTSKRQVSQYARGFCSMFSRHPRRKSLTQYLPPVHQTLHLSPAAAISVFSLLGTRCSERLQGATQWLSQHLHAAILNRRDLCARSRQTCPSDRSLNLFPQSLPSTTILP